jgi:hypothetical protein
MRLTVSGGCGAWPGAGQACSGYLVEHQGFRLLVDPGYAVLPRLLELVPAQAVDAVPISHGHPDHCADLHPLLRARALRDDPAPALPVHALPGAAERVLALDRPGLLDDAYALREFTAGDRFEVGPVVVASWPLPHSVPNAGLRPEAAGRVLAYTGDTGPSPDLLDLARDADVSSPRRASPSGCPPTPPATCPACCRPASTRPGRAPGGCCSPTCCPGPPRGGRRRRPPRLRGRGPGRPRRPYRGHRLSAACFSFFASPGAATRRAGCPARRRRGRPPRAGGPRG